jgi:hypothetical protein
VETRAATRKNAGKHFVLQITGTLCGVNMSQHKMYQYKIAFEDIMDRLTGNSTREELLSKEELSTEATERIAEANSQGRASNTSNRLLELRNQMERPNQQRGPRVMEQRGLNRQERRDQRNEAARLNRSQNTRGNSEKRSARFPDVEETRRSSNTYAENATPRHATTAKRTTSTTEQVGAAPQKHGKGPRHDQTTPPDRNTWD